MSIKFGIKPTYDLAQELEAIELKIKYNFTGSNYYQIGGDPWPPLISFTMVPRSMIATEKNASEDITYNNVMELLIVNESCIN